MEYLIVLSLIVSVLGFAFIAREVRLIAQAVAHVAKVSSRSKHISAKVLTMLAGIKNEDQ